MRPGAAACRERRSDPADAESRAEETATTLCPVDPLVDSSWDETVLRHDGATIFHSSAWARVLVETYGHRPAYCRWVHAGRTLALVPLMEVGSPITGRRGVCVPFADSCGPLAFPGTRPDELDRELAAVADGRGWKHLELRQDGSGGDTAGPTFLAHMLALHASRAELEAGFSASARRSMRRAARSGVTVQVSDSWRAMEEFYHLHLGTRQRHGVPPQPLTFFRNIHRELIAGGHGFVVTGRHGGRAVAASVFLHFGANGLYKFGASESAAWPHRPNHLVMAEGIFTLAERGVRRLHFGRTDPDQDGLRRFKRQWGADESALSYRQFTPARGHWSPVRNHSSGASEWMHRLCRRLPEPATRALGSLLYPHLD